MTRSQIIRVVPYHPEWPEEFSRLRDRIWPVVSDIAIGLEHVGSTAVPGLAAKPVIDMDIIVSSRDVLPAIVTRLAGLGYEHRGDLGIADRDAFRAPADQPSHHLYACSPDSASLRNHIVLRDHLRSHPEDAAAYARLKIELADRFSDDRERYVEGKTKFVLSILARYPQSPESGSVEFLGPRLDL
jgi:GrpB-like predicted nucleotidyltransferase (UPF0157 family)